MRLPGKRRIRALSCAAAFVAVVAMPASALAGAPPVPAASVGAQVVGGHVVGEIVGGRVSARNAYPWMTAIYYDGAFHCAGVLVAPSWVLTAAHCASPRMVGDLTLLIGRSDRAHGTDGEWRSVTAVKRDPDYVYDPHGAPPHDVALLKLDRPAVESPVRALSTWRG